MENLDTIRTILRAIERSLDTALNPYDISAEALGISRNRRDALLIMMQNEGLIDGINIVTSLGGNGIRTNNVRLTFKGLMLIEGGNK